MNPAAMASPPRTALVALVIAGLAAAGCRRAATGSSAGASSAKARAAATAAPEAPEASSSAAKAAGAVEAAPDPHAGKPLLGITAFVATIYKEPRDTSKKLGYLRVGAKVPRSAEPVGKANCPGGWYRIEPRGYVCAGDDATTDLDKPILKAATKRPNLAAPLPYKYAFVRAVLPLYVRIPTAAEQFKSEFKLQDHLDWFKQNGAEVSKVTLGANDVPIDVRGIPLGDKRIGELGMAKNSVEMGLGANLGGEGDNDPPPFWLEGGARAIPNISDFKIPSYAVFADRARRHTGLALVGSFPTGPESLERRFAVTTDMRLAPATKIKPDAASPWHGVPLDDKLTLPVAFVRSQGAHNYRIVQGKVTPGETVEFRSVHGLTGKMRTVGGVKYYRTTDKRWVSHVDVGLAVAPSTWPDDAVKGKKWVEISVVNQTMVLWEGKKPVYATLVSSGQAGLDDPKKTTATVRGVFRIRNKHITATMDSNESSAVGGKANRSSVASAAAPPSDDDERPARARSKKARGEAPAKGEKSAKAGGKKGDKGKAGSSQNAKSAKAEKEKSPEKVSDKPIPRRGDGEYGVTKRRGEGTFVLRDVPWIQYFESGYAIHAAYWHDVFGTPRSHGCVNLSPIDAHRLFLWTDPPVPEGWHAVNAGDEAGEGTLVVIHE
jgi:lipoprotein-anchoring transpeptidase ErfK/SrfK